MINFKASQDQSIDSQRRAVGYNTCVTVDPENSEVPFLALSLVTVEKTTLCTVITQDIRFRISLIQYAENFVAAKAAIKFKTNRQYHLSLGETSLQL